MKASIRPGFGIMGEMKHEVTPFDSALWSYTAKHGGKMSSLPGSKLLKHTYALTKKPVRMSDVAPVRQLSREIKMMSLNPSVYGNCYGVLGSS
jgi:hypothetical protein